MQIRKSKLNETKFVKQALLLAYKIDNKEIVKDYLNPLIETVCKSNGIDFYFLLKKFANEK